MDMRITENLLLFETTFDTGSLLFVSDVLGFCN